MADPKKVAKDYRKILKALKAQRADLDKDFEKLKKQNKSDLAKCKKAQDQADLMAGLVLMAGNLAGLVKAAHKSTKVTGDALSKLNKKVLIDTAKGKTSDLAQLIGDTVSDDVGNNGNLVLFAKATFKAWSDMNKVSFWAAAYTDMVSSKKFKWDPVSWAKYSDKIYKDSQSKVDAMHKRLQKNLDQRIKKYEKLVRELDKVKPPA